MDGLAESVGHLASEIGFSGVVHVDGADEELFTQAFGFAHRGFEVPNEVSTQFAIASGGKGFTALAVVGLIAEGALSLDSTARSVLGTDLPLIAEGVTVEHLLGHRSGIGDYLDEESEDLDLDDYVLSSPVQNLGATKGFLAEIDGHPTKFPPGERFSYSNAGYIVLAVIAERVSGVEYHDLVRDRVLGPAGMSDTGFLRSDEPSGRMALGYLHSEGLRTNVFHLPVRGNGDGGIYTTASDMRAFWLSLFRGAIVPQEWVRLMTSPHSEVPQEQARYGLGFWLDQTGPKVRLVGSDTGVSFYSSHDPARSSTWTVISNATDGAWPMVDHLRSVLG